MCKSIFYVYCTKQEQNLRWCWIYHYGTIKDEFQYIAID